MKKNLSIILIMAVTTACGAALSFARPIQRFDSQTQASRDLEFKNIRAGYEIFRNFCKSCHNRKSESASFLHAESRTMKGWNKVFERKWVKCAREGFWQKLTNDDLLKVNDYLYYYAYDSYDPYDPWDNDGFGFYFGW